MKTLKQIYNRLATAKGFPEKYPEYKIDDAKIHVLFLSPCLNETGYYRMILPALELNRTETHASIIASIHKWDFNKQFDDYDNPIDFRLVQWAHYVVLPAMFSDVAYIIKSMREINDDIEFLMDIDINYHQLPEYHPDFKKVTPELKSVLINNISKVDLLSAPNNQILHFYNRIIQQQTEEFLIYFERFNSLLSNYTFEEIPQIFRNKGEKIRIGIIVDASQGDDVKTIEKPLLTLLEQHGEKIEIVIFGWSKKIAEQSGLFNEARITYEKPVPFYEFHSRLNQLCFDIGLLPLVNNNFNQSGKAFNRFLDFSSLMVPVIAPKMSPLEKLIREKENGFIVATDQEWVDRVSQLITEGQLRKDMGESAFKTAWEHFSYTPAALQRLRSIFI